MWARLVFTAAFLYREQVCSWTNLICRNLLEKEKESQSPLEHWLWWRCDGFADASWKPSITNPVRSLRWENSNVSSFHMNTRFISVRIRAIIETRTDATTPAGCCVWNLYMHVPFLKRQVAASCLRFINQSCAIALSLAWPQWSCFDLLLKRLVLPKGVLRITCCVKCEKQRFAGARIIQKMWWFLP